MNLATLPAVIKRLIPTVRLPDNYQAAATALAACVSIDEVKEWADKSEGAACYAKQANDTRLFDLAQRIKNRAERRLGELLTDIHKARKPSKRYWPEVCAESGVRPRRGIHAVNLAAVKLDKFESSNSRSPAPRAVDILKEHGKYQPANRGEHEYKQRLAKMTDSERTAHEVVKGLNHLRLLIHPHGQPKVSAAGVARKAVEQHDFSSPLYELTTARFLAEWIDEFIHAAESATEARGFKK